MNRLNWIREQNKLPPNEPEIHIGEGCRIHPTVELGDDGYSMELNENNQWVRSVHHGGIRIGDNVHIGEYTVVKRATRQMDETIIADDAKLCSYVNVGHNCQIGKSVFIGPHVCLNGSVIVGDYAWIGAHAVLGQHSSIGSHSILGMGSVVPPRAKVPGNVTYIGAPAQDIRWKDNTVHPSFVHGEGLTIGKYNHIHENVRVGKNCVIRSFVELRPNTVIKNNCYLDSGVKSSGYCSIGNGVKIRYDSIIARNVEIGNNVFIAPQVMFINIPFGELKRKPLTRIEDNVCIGTNATINNGVTIAKGSIIGAKAFVKDDITEPGIYVGVPARRLKSK